MWEVGGTGEPAGALSRQQLYEETSAHLLPAPHQAEHLVEIDPGLLHQHYHQPAAHAKLQCSCDCLLSTSLTAQGTWDSCSSQGLAIDG